MVKFEIDFHRTIIFIRAVLMAAALLVTGAVRAQQPPGNSPDAPADSAKNSNSANSDEAIPVFKEELLAGEWKVANAKFAGREWPEEEIRNMRLSVTAREWENNANGMIETGNFQYPATPDGKPQQVDLVIEKGDSAGMTLEGIIRQNDTGFEVCYAVSGERPLHFESKEGSMNLLIRYERPK